MKTLFLSDLHLEDGRPDILAWALEFFRGPARSAEAVYILGDLFEYWIGDDALSASATALAEETSKLARRGTKLYFQHGNRDFLMGSAYVATAGFELLPETIVTHLYGTPTLLLHGDSLCTDDIDYQAFRQRSRDPDWQAEVLAMSVEERLAMAREARDASMKHAGSTTMDIMDVNEGAVRDAFAEHGVNRMIHGHTHRPATHRHELADGSAGTRIVLADWYEKGSYLEVSAGGAVSRTV